MHRWTHEKNTQLSTHDCSRLLLLHKNLRRGAACKLVLDQTHVATRQVHTFGRLSADIMATSSNKLAGKWCIVTGGGAGIGQAIAETFAAEGASIALVARSKDKLEEVVLPSCLQHDCLDGFTPAWTSHICFIVQVAKGCKSKGAPQVETYSVDLSDLQALDKFAKSFLSSHKHCDVLVNNAGVMGEGTPTEGKQLFILLVRCEQPKLLSFLRAELTACWQYLRYGCFTGDISKWEKCIQLNLLAPMALTHAFSPGMVEKKVGPPPTCSAPLQQVRMCGAVSTAVCDGSGLLTMSSDSFQQCCIMTCWAFSCCAGMLLFQHSTAQNCYMVTWTKSCSYTDAAQVLPLCHRRV